MRTIARKILADILKKDQIKRLKKLELKFKKTIASLHSPITRDELCNILTARLGVSSGETVMVHSSMSLLNSKMDADEIRDAILEVIGPNGNLVVPTFSPMSGAEYMRKPTPFDLTKSRSGMGALSETVRKTWGAQRSLHPTKSIACIGPQSGMICSGHEKCIYPFGVGSPFQKLLNSNARIIGIGVPMSYLSFVHVAEDMHPERVRHQVWDPVILEKICRNGDCEYVVSTRVHNMSTMAKANPAKFCRRHMPSCHFKSFNFRGTPFFVVSSQALYQSQIRGFDEGFSVYD